MHFWCPWALTGPMNKRDEDEGPCPWALTGPMNKRDEDEGPCPWALTGPMNKRDEGFLVRMNRVRSKIERVPL